MRRLSFLIFLCVVPLLSSCSLPQPAPTPPPPPPDYSALNAAVVQPAEGVTVSVLGAVKKPGNYRLKPGATLAEALEAAGGLAKIATPARTFVDRISSTGPRRLVIDCRRSSSDASHLLASDGDAIFVTEEFY